GRLPVQLHAAYGGGGRVVRPCGLSSPVQAAVYSQGHGYRDRSSVFPGCVRPDWCRPDLGAEYAVPLPGRTAARSFRSAGLTLPTGFFATSACLVLLLPVRCFYPSGTAFGDRWR